MSDGGPGGRLLIVNADDYGLTAGVSRAILDAAADGIVTSTSVLAVAPAFVAMAPALASSGIGAGAHLAAVGEDPPLLTAREVPTLVDKSGAFNRSWRQLLPKVAAGRIDGDDLRREFTAQFEAITAAGIAVTHVDTHQHVHLWPAVGRVVLDVAAAGGVSAVRIIRSGVRSPVGLTVNRLGRRFERRATAAGFRWPATATGLDEAGHLEGDRLVAAIDRLGAGGGPSAELATHPGEHGDADLDRYRWGYHWDAELAALRSTAARDAVARHGFRLGTYADLEPAVNPAVRRALAAYDDTSLASRLHTCVVWTCPFEELEARVPDSGRVLDIGCGHGLLSLLLALGSPAREVLGVDIDNDKIAAARHAAANTECANVRFEIIEPEWRPDAVYDAITVNDVLYLLGHDAARRLLRDLAAGLAPGGVLLVKEIDVRPWWKYQLARFQELVATRVTRITEGEEVDFLPPAEIGAALEASGLQVEQVPLHRGRPHPHHLVVGRFVA